MTQLFGQVYAPAYDMLYRDKDYDREVELLGRIFRQYGTQPVQTVLDLGCGTGNHTLRLAAKGHEVVGIDRSPEMLAEAGRKAIEQRVTAHFQQADIRHLSLRKTFDATLMMFAVLGYQTEEEDVRSVLQGARHHMPPNGLLIFDVWYGPAVLAQGPETRVRTIEHNGNSWVRRSSGSLDKQTPCCRVDFNLKHMRDGQVLEETDECHVMRYFSHEDIDRFLNESGFQLLRLGTFPELDRDPDHTTWNVMAVAAAR
jgi:SAM-dependent methyltransferase